MAETTVIDDRYIINAALARIGSSPVGSLDEDSSLCRQARSVYYDAIDAMLGGHDWIWARKLYKLTRLSETPENGWTYVYEMPGTRLSGPRRVLSNPRVPESPERRFFIEEDRLYADRDELWAQFTVRAAPHVWETQFRLAAIVGVAAQLCVPVTHDADLGAALRQEAYGLPSEGGRGGLYGRALSMDASSHPVQSPHWQDPLTSARWM